MSTRLTRPTVSSQQKVLPKIQYVGVGRSKDQLRSPKEPKFKWKVNEESGYFELGTPSAQDDLYIFHTTLVACENFHLLEPGLGDVYKPRESSFWSIHHASLGCNLESDPFELSNETDSRNTFIGDKITARVRCNGALFHEYLKFTSIEFRVFRAVGVHGKPGMVGVSFAELKELTKPFIKGIKATLDVIPHGEMGTTLTDFGANKPELRVIFEMNVVPNFFSQAESVPIELPLLPVRNNNESRGIKEITTKSYNDAEHKEGGDFNASATRKSLSESKEKQDKLNEDELLDQAVRDVVLDAEANVAKPTSDTTVDVGYQNKDVANPHTNRVEEGGDTLDGMVLSHQNKVVDADDRTRTRTNRSQKVENNLSNWSKEDIIKFKEELKEKERAYLQILQEEWSKRDIEREQKTSQIYREQASLKVKLESKEHQLIESETRLRKREREVEEFANKATIGLTQRVEEMKLRMGFMKDKHENDMDLAAVKLESAHTEIERLNGKIKSLELKLRAKEDEVDRLNSCRTQWPDISLERKLVRLEEKNAALLAELTKVRRERDSYKNGALSLVKRQNQLQSQRDAQLCIENDALRAKILMTKEKKDMRKERESIAEISKNLQAMTKAYSKKDTKNYEANLTEKIEKRTRSPPVNVIPCYNEASPRGSISSARTQPDGNNYRKYLNPATLSCMTSSEIDSEISRLVLERDRMIGTGDFLRYDPEVQNIDNALTRLASDLMARGPITGY